MLETDKDRAIFDTCVQYSALDSSKERVVTHLVLQIQSGLSASLGRTLFAKVTLFVLKYEQMLPQK
jgi:hypothetical protein